MTNVVIQRDTDSQMRLLCHSDIMFHIGRFFHSILRTRCLRRRWMSTHCQCANLCICERVKVLRCRHEGEQVLRCRYVTVSSYASNWRANWEVYSVTCPCLWRMLCSGCSLFSFDSCSWSLSCSVGFHVSRFNAARSLYECLICFFVSTSSRVYVPKTECHAWRDRDIPCETWNIGTEVCSIFDIYYVRNLQIRLLCFRPLPFLICLYPIALTSTRSWVHKSAK